MKLISVLIIQLFLLTNLFSQTLNLPSRQITAKSGSEVVSYITSMNLTDREDAIYDEITSGNVPDFMRNMVLISDTKTIGTDSYTIEYYVIPDYLALGSDSNYFLCPMTPLLAQKIADYTDCSLTTRKMVNDIWNAAPVKLTPSPIAPSAQMTTVPVFDQHNTTVWGQRTAVIDTYSLGTLVGGDKKDVVISNMIYGYPSPGRVVIYGWHQTNGTPIQQLYNGHEETYADYSHGIRLVQNQVLVNGNSSTVQEILTSSTLNTLLSDEGVIATPNYPRNIPEAQTPKSFCVLKNSTSSLSVNTFDNSDNEGYIVKYGIDGINFPFQISTTQTNFTISSLEENRIYYLKLASYIMTDTSEYSEVLAATTFDSNENVLIVNGFDRVTTGNTFDFIRQHGSAFFNNSQGFSSATNDAVIDNLVSFADYNIVDYILGEESTVNETFSSSEQNLVSDFLNNGGKLFVSGAEIAWDLDHLGSTSDKAFFNNYLKSEYIYDAPNNVSSTYYQISPIASSFFSDISDFYIDNGTQGTYNVKYPDIINALDGAENILEFSGLTNNFTAVSFTGIFPNGTVEGRLVYLGFPFETIYPESSRDELMQKILAYFQYSVSSQNFSETNDIIIYPNPNNGEFEIKTKSNQSITLEVYDMSGCVIYLEKEIVGSKKISLNNISKGIYFVKIYNQNNTFYKKISIY